MLIANPRSDVYPELVSFVTTDQRGDALIQLHQVHGDRVIILDNANNQGPYEADGLVTNRRQLPLRVSVADCGNIYAYDPVSQTIGIAHSGWRGTHKSIISNMIAAMTQLGASTENILLRSGPSICGKCYRFGPEVVDLFAASYYHLAEDGQYRLDLPTIRHDQALAAGVSSDHFTSCDICTYEDPQCYSYRRNQTSQRMIGVICLQ